MRSGCLAGWHTESRRSTLNLSSADPHGLARFYADLLGWDRPKAPEPTWVVLRGGTIPLSFELDERYRPPVWPTEAGEPPTQMHLEVQVDDLDGALEHARACGVTPTAYQPQDDVRVCLDPAGHPFCCWVDPRGRIRRLVEPRTRVIRRTPSVIGSPSMVYRPLRPTTVVG